MASLLNDINAYKASFSKKASQEKKHLFAQAIKELEESGVAQGLHVGDPAPDFTLPDATGKGISLSKLLADGPVILTFYRGGWCPYCNLELRAYQRALSEIKESGAQLIAISPQTPDASLSTKEKDELEYLVLSDEGGKVAQQFDLVFKMQDYLIDLYKQSGMDIPAHNGDETWELPKPATFVIDQQRNVIFAHVDSDYRNRTEPSEVIKIVKNL
jgi:peroxiredoxin